MSIVSSLVSGLVGSATLTAVHQGAKRFIPHAPQVDAIGRRAIAKGMRMAGATPPTGERLQTAALVGDLVSNAFYYALINLGHPEHRVARGAAVGLLGGIGAVVLPGPMGLGKQPGQRTPRTEVMTVAWYTLGGIAAGLAANMMGAGGDEVEDEQSAN